MYYICQLCLLLPFLFYFLFFILLHRHKVALNIPQRKMFWFLLACWFFFSDFKGGLFLFTFFEFTKIEQTSVPSIGI